MRLKDKVAIITGAGLGMGREASVLFAEEGAKIIGLDVNAAALEETAALVKAAGSEMLAVAGDVSKEADVKNAIAQGVARFGKLDILYANAGVLWKDRDFSVLDTTEENWDIVQAINLKGPFFLTKHGIPELKKSGGGSIILIGSISALAGFDLAQDSYTCAKGALISLTKSLAVQFGPDKIRANIIHPGMIDTPLQAPYLNDEKKKNIASGIPIRRLGVARDIAYAALYLASDESTFCTGSELVVDGGFYAM
ncbi:MAG: 2-(R)-hydroxypropyl-CoM dehydrogenase [Candidatus Hydrogenedentes bacterium ADurb.Bin170]|jgi:NAD(P)-dependent dehydrogenase (short-subunit alcohol dehydrogenase family)|nr:MAG: 2-(R)-hydroxypropyl-CoM dehydrogenase [Candidatus Hydrogenedentes bacterium ADurb.Bin170]